MTAWQPSTEEWQGREKRRGGWAASSSHAAREAPHTPTTITKNRTQSGMRKQPSLEFKSGSSSCKRLAAFSCSAGVSGLRSASNDCILEACELTLESSLKDTIGEPSWE